MEQVRGVERGSYIWGRSVHNIRIERLWLDVTVGFGKKWKDFFRLLEAHDGLNTDMDSHIWLLHFLFLSSINQDAEDWAGSWNAHTLSRRGEPYRSPKDLYVQGMVEHGVRGIAAPVMEPDGEEVAEYGIDWDDIDNHRIQEHFQNANPGDGDPNNPFIGNHPNELSHVEVPDARCPFSQELIATFSGQIQTLPHFNNTDMASRRLL
ncbi:hypothetical protein BV25DRAFT_1872599 [Artomyces pyxidatus]|uniref:Uncharacterized protein n=1 Tax=Artomyces pyxidatus TaxID=48021 RepID=A0ACB8SKS9_9AGAM|nr:hypothetical protein BV25DRAFT_1872599 [Artomyces pyxidatus]